MATPASFYAKQDIISEAMNIKWFTPAYKNNNFIHGSK